VIRNPGERCGKRNPRSRKRSREKFLHYSEHVLLPWEAHLQIHLGELELAVGPQVFIAEAARDLEVAIEPADHQNLFENLRRLRQSIELARMHAAGYQEIARALGGRFAENGCFNLDKSLVAQALAN